MKKYLILTLIILIGFLGINAFAADLLDNVSLFNSITTTGIISGGLRYDFQNGFTTNGTIGVVDDFSGTETSTYAYYLDTFYGPLGLGIAGTETTKARIMLLFGIEHPITEKIAVGIITPLINYQSGTAIGFLTSYDIAVVIKF